MDNDGDRPSENPGLSADEAFAMLANETRMDILRLLWEEHEPYADSALTFSEILEEVDYEDTGNFSYHLEKLIGPFVRKTAEGYELREAAHKVLRSVHAGTVTESPTFDAELDQRCPNCGGAIEASYSDDRLFVRCMECSGVLPHDTVPEGTFFAAEVPPAILEGRCPEGILQAAITWNASQYGAVTRGVCPDCTARLDRTLDICENHPVGDPNDCSVCGSRFAVWVRHVCENCGYSRYFGLWPYAWQHPEVNRFYLDHGVDVNGLTWDKAVVLIDSIDREEVFSMDPLCVRQVIRIDEDRLAVTFDADLDVVDVSE